MEEFLQRHPKFEDFLRSFVRNEEDKINKQMENFNKEEVLEKVESILRNVKKHTNINNLSSIGFKYKVEKLKSNDGDYRLLENSLKLN